MCGTTRADAPRSPRRCASLIAAALVGLAVHAVASADDPPAAVRPIKITDPLPYGRKAIDYFGPETNDPAAKLNERLDAGKVVLDHEPPRGYLRSLLEALDVPVESQLLVFSKTALNPKLVGPKTPRAIYFSDEVYVGWVPGAAAIEVAAIDPVKGPMFYLLPQEPSDTPRLRREERCLACHVGSTTLQVPGLMVRSFLTDDAGTPLAGYSRVTHDTDFAKRFGGWYVTGTHGEMPHSGNIVGEAETDRHRREPLFGGNVTDLSDRIDTSLYLTPHSDLIAHLTLHHQAHAQNLLTRVGYEARLGRRSDAEEQLVRYLLFLDAAELPAGMKGTSGFRATELLSDGIVPSTIRDAERLVESRLERSPPRRRISRLLESSQFRALPRDVAERIRRRIAEFSKDGLTAPD